MKNVILFVLLFVSSMAFSQSKETFTCGQMTKKGAPCKNRVTEAGARCWMHGGSTKTDVRAISVQCSAIAKSTGNRCRNKTTNPSGLCHVHSK